MNARRYIYMLCAVLLFSACEDLIDVDLNDADPRIVIEANLSDLHAVQRIRVSKTVGFGEPVNSIPVSDATVFVHDDRGSASYFQHNGDGIYLSDTTYGFVPTSGRTYTLQVMVDDELFESSCYMPPYVDVDSTGIVRENIFGDDYYFATFKFNDPPNAANYYRYDVAINNGDFRFSSVFQDKFNDGLFVTHQVSDLNAELEPGDYILVRRYCIDEKVFSYWNEYQSTNPGSAAPGNPTSNISNNALGYFSVASGQEYVMQIMETDIDWDDID